jgi:hypothetical protein
MLIELLMPLLRSRKRYPKDVVSFIHAALRPLFLVVFDISLTSLSEPLLKRELQQCPTTIFLYVFELLLFLMLIPRSSIINGSLRCLVQFLCLLEQLLLNECVIVQLPPAHLLCLLLRPQLLEVLSHQLLYQLLVKPALLLGEGGRRRRVVGATLFPRGLLVLVRYYCSPGGI